MKLDKKDVSGHRMGLHASCNFNPSSLVTFQSYRNIVYSVICGSYLSHCTSKWSAWNL